MSDTEYDPMDPGNEDSNDRYTTMPKFAALQTAPLLFQSQHIQTQLLPLPLTAPVAPWLISTQHIPLPPSTHHHPPPMSHPPPPSAPLPPSQPILPSAHYQPPPPPRAVIPAPPNVDIPPPPPPLATVETVDEDYVHESAYSPSQAEDDEVEKKKVLDKIEKNAISLAQQKQNEIENLIRNKEKESHEHTRRMEMENKKIEELRRRKINNSLGPIKLKKIKMKGFEADDDQGNEIIEKEIEGKSSIIKTDKTKQSSQQTDVDDNTEINSKPTSSVKAHFMTQVASYLIHNPSQASTFLKSKRNDKDYEFLYDIERLTKDGKMYREISEKLQAEKNVRNIVNDPVQNFTNSVTLIGVTTIAKNIPSGGAPDYSLLNPFMDPTVHHVPSIAAIQSVASSTISSSGSRFSNSNGDSITNNSIIQKGNHVITTPLLSSSSISASTSLPTSASTSADVPKSNRRNRWGPSVIDTTQLILPVSLRAPAAVSVPVPMMSTVSVPVTGMLAKFQGQSRGQNQELSNLFDERDEERERIRAGQVREQKELQLLEGRIREAASQSIVKNKNYSSSGNSGSGVGAGGSSSSLINSSSNMDNQSTDRQNDLNKERLIEYNLLAARYNETDQKDTIDDAERNRGKE